MVESVGNAGLQRAGDFIIDVAEMVTSTGIRINLLNLIVHLVIFEDIQSNAITGDILLSDTIDMATLGPILGQEYLSLKLRTMGVEGEPAVIDFTQELLHITSLGSRTKSSQPNVQYLMLNFTTRELSKNERVTLNRSFEGTCSEIVENILKNDLKTKKNLFIEPSDGVKKYIFPDIRPFEAINQLKREAVAVGDSAPTYMFYEDLKGYHFRSLSTMYNEETLHEYFPSVVGSKPKPEDAIDNMKAVITVTMGQNGDILQGQNLGQYASHLTVYDSYARRFKNFTYNYLDNFKNEQHVSTINKKISQNSDFPVISETPVEGNSRLSDFPIKSYFVPTANKIEDDGTDNGITIRHLTRKGKYVYAAYRADRWLQRRQSQLIQLDSAVTLNIEVYGNTVIRCGSIVKFDLPLASFVDVEGNEDRIDKFYRGRFLVKAIRHDFEPDTKIHEMVLSLCKDSLPVELSSLKLAITDQPVQDKSITREFNNF